MANALLNSSHLGYCSGWPFFYHKGHEGHKGLKTPWMDWLVPIVLEQPDARRKARNVFSLGIFVYFVSFVVEAKQHTGHQRQAA
jgi:hypothetical protein